MKSMFQNWYTNQGILRRQCPMSERLEYLPIRFAERRMISQPTYFELDATIIQEEGLPTSKEKEEELKRKRTIMQKLKRKWEIDRRER
jgi:hypothetical protein